MIQLFSISYIFYFILHSLLAHQSTKQVLMKTILPLPYYRLFFNIVSLGLLLPLYWMYKQTSAQFLFSTFSFSSIIASICTLVGIGIMSVALLEYNLAEFSGFYQLKNKENFKANELKRTGLNRYIRHPLYTGMYLIIWGLLLLYPYPVHLSIAIITSLYLYIGTRLEEQKLLEEFGAAYLNYRKEVGMFIPKF